MATAGTPAIAVLLGRLLLDTSKGAGTAAAGRIRIKGDFELQ